MTLAAFYNEEAVKVGDETLRLVINFHTIDATESLLGRDYDSLIAELTNPAVTMPVATQAKTLWGLLREHHPEINIDQVMTLVYDPEIGVAIGLAMHKLIKAAFPMAEKPKGKNPPKRRGASKAS